jgi:phthiocerol/phenolphthiocerol synthesis type-I polyketide synthase C
LPPLESAAWLLLADSASAELTGHLSIRLESLGQRVETTEWLAGQNLADFRHVVHLRGWNGTPETSVSLLTEALGDVQTVAAHSGKSPRLWFIARGGALASELPVSPASRAPNPAQAALWGFGRVVMNEHPALDCTLIDLACDPLAADTLNRLENELLRPDGANEVVLADSGRYTLVLREEADHVATPATEGERFRLDFHLPGQLRNLAWLRQEERSQETGKAAPSVSWPLEGTNEQSEFLVVGSLREDEVEVRVQATGLNFRDVMYALGMLSDEAVEAGFAGASLGLECAGIVSAAGRDVRGFAVGDRVLAFGGSCFGRWVTTRESAAAHLPGSMSMEAAATIPTTFFTAYYALYHLARLGKGESVLIHGGAGGVGIAAIQLARHIGRRGVCHCRLR